MAKNQALRRWSELRGLPVTIPSEGRKAGTVEDFYFQTGTNAIYALRVNVGILGYRVLMASAIKTIERDAVTIANEEMLIKQQPGGQLPEVSGQSLLSYKVMSENGTFVGTVSDLLLGVVPPVALRVAAFELGSGPEGRFSRPKIVDADEVVGYQDNVIVILDQVARGL